MSSSTATSAPEAFRLRRRRNHFLRTHLRSETTRKVVPSSVVETMLASGVLIYAGTGLAGILFGGNYLDYFVLDSDPVHGQHRGIFWVEVRMPSRSRV